MVVTTIISFTASKAIDSIVEALTKDLKLSHKNPSFVIGTKAQDPTTVQVTTFWPHISASSALTTSPDFQTFMEGIRTTTSVQPTTVIVTNLTAPSTPSVTAPLPLTEWVKIDFPASSITPSFQTQVESDFARFESIFRQRGPAHELGEGPLSTGWAEEQNGVRSFVVSRGWEDMKWFEKAVGTESFKEGVGILMGWGVPFELWHVETKASGGL